LDPPQKFKETIINLLQADHRGIHGYMPNAGIPNVREKLAAHLAKVYQADIKPEMVILTVGAAGALNTAFKTIVENGDTVLVLAPFFMEYNYYADNHGAKVVVAQTDKNFRPDLQEIEKNITKDTRALLINSPNNPTGVIYTLEELKGIGDVLRKKSKEYGRSIILIADEPYRKIVYNNVEVPSVFHAYENSVVVNSFSKDLSLAGERIGYLCLNPKLEDREEFATAATLANRILGYVNAPALMQRAVAELLDVSVDIGIYQKRVETLTKGLTKMGYKLIDPQGTFYLFPESPIADDKLFIDILKKELILAVPGSGFSRPGHFRLSLCLGQDKIELSLAGFAQALKNAKN
jgi:aspartate aminotransferase